MTRSWHGDFGQEVLVRGGRGFVYTAYDSMRQPIKWWVGERNHWADVPLAEFDTEEEAVKWLRLWRLMNGLNEDGTAR